MSPDQRLLVYASISPVAFVVNVGSRCDVVSVCARPLEAMWSDVRVTCVRGARLSW
jgi:hypothetical protein